MDCKVCFDKYDEYGRKPIILMPCCHTFCLNCVISLRDNYGSKLLCPKCRESIQLFKPNYFLIELMKPDSKFKPQYSRVYSVNKELFYSENHEHDFRLLKDRLVNEWSCHGRIILGGCKSFEGLNDNDECYGCTLCNVNFCKKCLEFPRISDENFYTSENHKHKLLKSDTKNINWICSGLSLFGKCKSGLNEFNLSHNKTRYVCTECSNDFELCEECLKGPKIVYESNDKFKLNESVDLNLNYLFSDQTLNTTLN